MRVGGRVEVRPETVKDRFGDDAVTGPCARTPRPRLHRLDPVSRGRHHLRQANGVFDGFPDNTFRQNNNINRGNAGRTFYNTAQTPLAWADTMTAPPNMLFRSNLPPP